MIFSKLLADLDIKGKGTLYVTSTYNNGIASTKDLTIKNLTLEVNVPNNALKGNDFTDKINHLVENAKINEKFRSKYLAVNIRETDEPPSVVISSLLVVKLVPLLT